LTVWLIVYNIKLKNNVQKNNLLVFKILTSFKIPWVRCVFALARGILISWIPVNHIVNYTDLDIILTYSKIFFDNPMAVTANPP
jgi:hypothetical protein